MGLMGKEGGWGNSIKTLNAEKRETGLLTPSVLLLQLPQPLPVCTQHSGIFFLGLRIKM
jgi:hypothetical protein